MYKAVTGMVSPELHTELRALSARFYTLELDQCNDFTVDYGQIQALVENGHRSVQAILQPPATLGFAAMMGVTKEFEQVFPYGAKFVFYAGSTQSTASIAIDNPDPEQPHYAMAEAMPDSDRDFRMEYASVTEDPTDPESTIVALATPRLLIAAAHFTVDLTTRAAQRAA